MFWLNSEARRQSQEKAVIGNLQGLAGAAEQYFRENQVTGVSYHELVGPGRYVRNVYPVAGETYDHLFFVKGEPVRVRLPGKGWVIEYPALGSGPAESR